MSTQKFRFASDRNGNIIDVTELTKAKKSGFEPFKCLGCGNQMLPFLGNIQTKHFRHKNDSTCSQETYLHNFSKKQFYKTYQDCLNSGKPFYLKVPYQGICDKYKDLGIICKNNIIYKSEDLTSIYDKVFLEKQTADSFIADVLLVSSNNKYPDLLIEISVSHDCSQEKINSENKIVELKVECESDVINFLKGIVIPKDYRNKNNNVRAYNLILLREKRNLCKEDCNEYDIPVYILENDGSIFCLYLSPKDALNREQEDNEQFSQSFAPTYIDWDGFADDSTENQQVFTRNCLAQNLYIKACTACKHHGESFNKYNSVYCFKKRKALTELNHLNCTDFERFNSVNEFDYEIRRQKNRRQFTP